MLKMNVNNYKLLIFEINDPFTISIIAWQWDEKGVWAMYMIFV